LLTPLARGGEGSREMRALAKSLEREWLEKDESKWSDELRAAKEEMGERARKVAGRKAKFARMTPEERTAARAEAQKKGRRAPRRAPRTNESARAQWSALFGGGTTSSDSSSRASEQKSTGQASSGHLASLARNQQQFVTGLFLQEGMTKRKFAQQVVLANIGIDSTILADLYNELNDLFKNNPKRRNPMAKAKKSKKTGNWKGRMMKYQTFTKRLTGCGLTPTMKSQLWAKYKATGKLPALADMKRRAGAQKKAGTVASSGGVTKRKKASNGRYMYFVDGKIASKAAWEKATGKGKKAAPKKKSTAKKSTKGKTSQKTKVGQEIQKLRREAGMRKIDLRKPKYDTLAKRRAELKKLKDQLAGKAPKKKKSTRKSSKKTTSRAGRPSDLTAKQMWDMYRTYRMKHSGLKTSSGQRMKSIQRDWKNDKQAILAACKSTRRSFKRCMTDHIQANYTTFSAVQKKVRKGSGSKRPMQGPALPPSIQASRAKAALASAQKKTGANMYTMEDAEFYEMYSNPFRGDYLMGAQGAALSTPFAFLDGIIDQVQDAVSDLPLVDVVAPYVKPVGLGLLVAGVHYAGGRYLGPQIQKVPALQGLDKAGYTIVGLGTALAIKLGQQFDLFESAQADQVAMLAVLTGAFVDGLDYFRGQYGQPNAVAGIAMSGYGDGGQYFTAPVSQGTQAPLRRHMRQLAAPQSDYSAIVAPLSGVAGTASGYGALMYTGAGF
jgi:hypothetical protein